MAGRALYLIGGAPRVGKSSLARCLLAVGIPWLPTDVIRTVVRRVVPELDALDQGLVDAAILADYMYPHIENAAQVCGEENDRFLIEGFDIAPSFCGRLVATLAVTDVRACFLGHDTFTLGDVAGYRGPKPQHEDTMSRAELDAVASWIRQRSHQLRFECDQAGLPYLDVGELGFEATMREGRRHLLG